MLIFPRIIEVRLNDHVATAASGGYDTDEEGRRRVKRVNPNDGSTPPKKLLETRTVKFRAQYESGQQRQVSWTPTGDVGREQAGFVTDAEELGSMNLLHPKTNMPMLGMGDRVMAEFDADTGELLFRHDPPGVQIVEVRALDKLPGFPQPYFLMIESRPQGGTG